MRASLSSSGLGPTKGGGEANSTFLMERYSIINGKIQYLGCYVPKNAAGFSVTFLSPAVASNVR